MNKGRICNQACNTLSATYETLLKEIRLKIDTQVNQKGVLTDGRQDKFLDLREFDFFVGNYGVHYLNTDLFIDHVGQQCDFSLVEQNIRELCKILDQITSI